MRRLRDNLSETVRFRENQASYLDQKLKAYAGESRLTHANTAYLQGYLRGLEEITFRGLFHVRRIQGQPETASSAKWEGMTEELRQAIREHRTESCLAWDEKGEHEFSEWKAE